MTTITATMPSLRSPWVSLGVPMTMAALLYAPLFPALFREWIEFPNLSHGVAIPVIAAYLVWAKRDQLATMPLVPSFWGLPILLLGLLGLVVGVQGQESFVARISLPVTLFGLCLMLAGSAVMAKVWLGIAYLVFMIPLPWSTMKLITYRSRLFDAAISTEVASWLGVPVYRDGVMLHLPNIVLEVADACSSIPAIAALTSLGVAYATLAPRRLASRVTLIVATLPFAIMSNIIRLITTVAGVYYIGPVTLESLYHQFNGTVNFLLTFFLLLALDSWLVRFERKEVR